jgi:hypothetical protein
VIVLSGDVHYAYVATLRAWGDGSAPQVPVHQLVSSPLCYDLYRTIAGGFQAIVSPFGERVGRWLSRVAGAPPLPAAWSIDAGPVLHNVVTHLELSPDDARVRIERTRARGALGTRLETASEGSLDPTATRRPRRCRRSRCGPRRRRSSAAVDRRPGRRWRR